MEKISVPSTQAKMCVLMTARRVVPGIRFYLRFTEEESPQ